MNIIRVATQLGLRRLTTVPVSGFANDSWKDRDEAAEKVFINRK
jgi:hypothetical protein